MKKSGRIVLEIDAEHKEELYSHLRIKGQTLKGWFIDNMKETRSENNFGTILNKNKHSAFISHASEDKDSFVRPLAMELQRLGHDVWYDEFELEVGDSLRQSIDQGLSSSLFGIVVLSKSFFDKDWPQYELNGLLAKEINNKKVILPVWHGVSREDIVSYSPILADKLALTTYEMGLKQIAEKLSKILKT